MSDCHLWSDYPETCSSCTPKTHLNYKATYREYEATYCFFYTDNIFKHTRTVTTGFELSVTWLIPALSSNDGLHVSCVIDIDVTWQSSLPIVTEMSCSESTRFKCRPWQHNRDVTRLEIQMCKYTFISNAFGLCIALFTLRFRKNSNNAPGVY